MSIFIIFFVFESGYSCIPVSLPDDTDGFTTTTTAATTTTTTSPNCLTQCQSTSAFISCSSVSIPSGYTCDSVSAPTSTRSGTTCSFTLDCSSFGSTSYPYVQKSGVATAASSQAVTFTCPDGGSQWSDTMTEDFAACASPPPTCLTTCQSTSSFTDCNSITLPSGYTCDAVSPAPTATRTGTTCSFTLDCTPFGTYPYIQVAGTTSQASMQTATFTCDDGQTQWTDSNSMVDEYAVCAEPPNCLVTCNPVSAFTDCATATAVPADHTCQTVSPTPTSTRSGFACTFVLDCSSLGPSSYPIFISGGVADAQTGYQMATLTCSDGSFNWIDNVVPQTDDMAVCGYANCLSTSPAISTFTDCTNTAVTTALSLSLKTCQPPSSTSTVTRTGTTCSFTLTCTSPATVNVIKSGVATDTGMMSVTFTCADFASTWSDTMPEDFGVCAM